MFICFDWTIVRIMNIFEQTDSNRSRSFTLSGNSNVAVNAMVGGGTQGTPNSCINDWLLIGCARVADRLPQSNTCEDRICGGTFNAEVSSMSKTVTSKSLYKYFQKKIQIIFFRFLCNFLLGICDRSIAGSLRPFRLHFHTDAVEAPNDIDNKGFCLDYVQQPCTNG